MRERSRSPRGSEEIVELVYSREQARYAKDWARADQLRDQLSALGVTLFDKTNQWKATDGRSGHIPTFSELEASNGAPPPVREAVEEPAEESPPLDDAEAQIRHLIQLREQARAAKDFAQSDRLRDELKDMGVELLDKEKLWRTKTGLQGCIIGYRGAAGATDKEINILVREREKARQGSDFALADQIRQELKKAGVEIKDKEKMWKASDGRSGPVPSWAEINGGAPEPPVGQVPLGALSHPGHPVVHVRAAPPPVQQVQVSMPDLQAQLIQAALLAAQNPDTALRTLQILQQATGIVPSAPVAVAVAPAPVRPTRASPPAPSPVPRVGAVSKRPQSSSVPPDLREALDLINRLKDMGRPAELNEIEWLVHVRERMRQNKDFSSSDELRNSMRSSLGIELQEKEKMWVASDGRSGRIPSWSDLQG